MAVYRIGKGDKQSKPLKASQVFALHKQGKCDHDDVLHIEMPVSEFINSTFGRDKAVSQSL